MKPILALLIILTLCIPSAVLAGVNTSAVISTPEVTRLEGIFGKNMDGLLGKQYLIAVYDIRSLDADIHAKIDASGIYANSIQMHSKESAWNKKNFLNFVSALKSKDTKKATAIFSKFATSIDPFGTTCCALYKRIAFLAMKNGILTLSLGGQEGVGYRLEYMYYKDNYLYQLAIETGFWEYSSKLFYCKMIPDSGIEGCPLIQQADAKNTKELWSVPIVKRWFTSPKLNQDFSGLYDSFITNMAQIWK